MADHEQAGAVNDERSMALFVAAMSRPAEERAALLAEACAGDGALRASVQRRVDWETRMNGFLLHPVITRETLARPFAAGDLLLQRFRILDVAGEGGMGVVYAAQDEKLGHRIALKCPHFEFRRRVSPEVLQSLRVTHPNVCRVFEIHTAETPTGDVDFLTMEYIEGVTLGARLAETPPGWLFTSEGEACVRQLCAGLAAVHAQGVIHRDLKPSNVMIAQDAAGGPRAVIMDFGLAQSLDVFSSQLRGTPAYIAPELWMGYAATPRSDLYALAALFFEMATGRTPFAEDTPWPQRLRAAPRMADVRGQARAALARCLDPDPSKRFGTAEELAATLWPATSRRVFAWGGVALAAAGSAGVWARNRWWPSSPVRLALPPPVIAQAGEASGNLVRGFVHDLAYRLKMLRDARRPLTVLSEGAAGATHQLKTTLGGALTLRLSDAAGGMLTRLDLPADGEFGAKLFSLQTTLMGQLIQALQLGADPPRSTGLTPAVYPAYVEALRITREEYQHAARAIPLFEQVVRGAPQSALAHAGLAEALLDVRFIERKPELETPARLALEKAEQLDPHLPEIYLVTGRLELIAGHYERSRTSYQRAAELMPNEPQVYISMAYPVYMTNRFEEAEAALRKAIAINPAYYKPYVDAGFLAQNRRQHALAEQHWRQALRLGPRDLIATRVDLARLLVNSGRNAEAEALLDEAGRIRTTTYELEVRGDLRAGEGKLAEAIAWYEKAIPIQTPDYRLWSPLGTYYARAGRAEEARKAWHRGVAATEAKLGSNRRQPDALSWLALYHAKLGDAALVDSLAQEAHLLAGRQQWTVCKLLVLAYGILGRTRDAIGLMAGAPPDLLTELARSLDLSPELRRHPLLQR